MDIDLVNQTVAMMNPQEQVVTEQIAQPLIREASKLSDEEFIQQIKPRLRAHEGVALDENGNHILYKDSLGKMTGGIGHLITPKDKKYAGKPEGTIIDPADVARWEMEDTKTALSDAKNYLGDSWKDSSLAVKEVATNMAFNLGRTKLSQFKELRKALVSGDMQKASDEILFDTKTGNRSKWAGQVKGRADDLAAMLNPPSSAR